MNTGARVTYAMGKDDEVPEHFGMLHAEIALARTAPSGRWPCISAVIGVRRRLAGLRRRRRSHRRNHRGTAARHLLQLRLYYRTTRMAALPNSLLTITLTSNFGTFILYALSCFLCIVAFHKRPDHSFLRHTLIPGFGLLANIVCMAFYLISPIFGLGTFKEPLLALGISFIWGIYGAIYFLRAPSPKAKPSCLNPSRPSSDRS